MPPVSRQTHRATASIASGQSLSNAINLGEKVIVGIQFPAGWDTAAVTFQGSADGTTYGDVYDDGGTEVTIASGSIAGGRVLVNSSVLEKLAALNYFKIRSGTTGTPVNQTAIRDIAVMMKA